MTDLQVNQIILVSLGTSIVVVTAISILIYRKYKRLLAEKERKEQSLEKNSIGRIIRNIDISIDENRKKISKGKEHYKNLIDQLEINQNQLKFIDVNLLPPIFKYDDRELLKERIKENFEEQYQKILKGEATTAHTQWSWNGSKKKGAQMVDAYQSLLLRAFNAEFEAIRKQMRHSTYDTAIEKVWRMEEQLRRLGETANVTISNSFVKLKLKELSIWNDELQYREKMKQEKKRQQELIRQQSTEIQRNQIEEEIEDLEENIFYRKSDLKKAQKIARELHGENALDMKLKIQRMQIEIEKLERHFERAISQAQITKAGYIYVISNIGSFGKGIVKIGMTRRLEPLDRIAELSNASVPFKFDVHTLTFVEDAPRIENLLHHKFSDKRVNIENNRKEFFNVTPHEVAREMNKLNIDCDWYFDVEAKEFHESFLIQEAFRKNTMQVQSSTAKFPETI